MLSETKMFYAQKSHKFLQEDNEQYKSEKCYAQIAFASSLKKEL